LTPLKARRVNGDILAAKDGHMPLVATITMNPAIDLSSSVDRVEPARKLRCHSQSRDPGGGGVNVARVVHRLGGAVLAFYPAGGLTGEMLKQLVRQEGVESCVTPIQGETREDVTILDEHTGEQYRFVLPGPRLHGQEWLACLDALAKMNEKPAVVCASGSLPPGAPEDFYCRVGEIAAGFGARFVLDASGAPLRAAMDAHLHLIKPNLNELRDLVGGALETEAAQVSACRTLLERRRIDAVALTLADRGALLVTAQGAWRARPLPVQALSAVGAGDSFLGGMVWATAAGKPLVEAFRFGAAAGAAAVLAPGTELAHAMDIRRLAPSVAIEEIAAAAAET
jgi:6-phosphofructokinase 2